MDIMVRISKEKKEKDFRMVVIPSGRDKIGIIQTKDYGIIAYPDKKDFDEYELKGIYLNKDKIEQNILKIVINNEPLNKSQMENLKRVVEHATEDGIKVEAVILK